jgi:hypothetical protein
MAFQAGSFTSGAWSNIAETETFTILQLTADLAGPPSGGVLGVEDLNNRGFFDVTFTVPAYASSLVVASVTDLEPEFTVTGLPAGKTLVLDANQAPVLLSGNTYRYFFTGTAETDSITVNFIGGSVTFLDAAGREIPLFAPQDFTVYNRARPRRRPEARRSGRLPGLDVSSATGAWMSAWMM